MLMLLVVYFFELFGRPVNNDAEMESRDGDLDLDVSR